LRGGGAADKSTAGDNAICIRTDAGWLGGGASQPGAPAMSTSKELAREWLADWYYDETTHTVDEEAVADLAGLLEQQRLEEARDWNEMLKVQDLRAADETWRKNRMYAREREAESLGATGAGKDS